MLQLICSYRIWNEELELSLSTRESEVFRDNILYLDVTIFIEEIGVVGQRKIRNAVVGAGGLGSPVIQYPAAAAVGTLAVVDFDVVELHNLNRQITHFENQVGNLKTQSVVHYVEALNPHINFVAVSKKTSIENAYTVWQVYDIIVDGSDNFSTRFCC